MKKLLLALGSLGAIASPIVAVVSCGDDKQEATIDGLIHNQDGKVVIAIGDNILPNQLSTVSIEKAFYKLKEIGDVKNLTHVEIVLTHSLSNMIHGVSFHATFVKGEANDMEKFVSAFRNVIPTTVNDIKTGFYSRGSSSLGNNPTAPTLPGTPPSGNPPIIPGTPGTPTPPGSGTPIVPTVVDLANDLKLFADQVSTFTETELIAALASKTIVSTSELGILMPTLSTAGLVPVFRIAPLYAGGLFQVTVILNKPGEQVTNNIGTFMVKPKG